MRVLLELTHPAQVQFFRPLAEALCRDGDEVLATSRIKDETIEVLDTLGMRHVCLSRIRPGLPLMALELAWRTARLIDVARRFRADVLVGKSGGCVGLAGRAVGRPVVVFEDTEIAWLQIHLSVPLATVVCTGMGYGRSFGDRQLHFNAPPQLAYTHPHRFTPDRSLLLRHGIDPDSPLIVFRIKAWRAMHDAFVRGPSDDELVRMVESLKEHGQPIISAERPLPAALQRYASPIPAGHALDLLAFARFYVGEGSSMAAEAGCLGTPAIFISPASRRGYLDEMERRYGHVTTVATPAEAAERAREWLSRPDLGVTGREARRQLLADCVDPLPFMLEVVRRCGSRRAVDRPGLRPV
jgi:predicted glycosyltransferase